MPEQLLAVPGPTPLHPRVRSALDRQPINHRGAEFGELLYDIAGKLQQVFFTESRVYTMTSSGTGVMQAAVTNCFERGERILILSNGFFGERFVQIAKCSALDAETMHFPWGTPIQIEDVEKRLLEDSTKSIKGVLLQLNETSTGVLNDAQSILQLVANHGALSVVDGISGLTTAPFFQDEWGADVVLGASQKGFMMPAGLAFISVNEKARAAMKKVQRREFYFHVPTFEEYFERGEVPFTPNVNLMFGLSESLDIILQEGMLGCWARHEALMQLVRQTVKRLGFTLLASEEYASPAVTTVTPGNTEVDITLLRSRAEQQHNLVFAGGLGPLKDDIFRLAHLGYVNDEYIGKVLSALEAALHDVRHDYR